MLDKRVHELYKKAAESDARIWNMSGSIWQGSCSRYGDRAAPDLFWVLIIEPGERYKIFRNKAAAEMAKPLYVRN